MVQRPSFRYSLAVVALSAIDRPSLDKSLSRLDSEVAQVIFQNMLRLSKLGALYPSSFLPNSHGEPHGVAIEKRTAPQVCPISIFQFEPL